MTLPETYRAVVLDQQRELQKLVHGAGIEPIRKMYEDMLGEVERKLSRTPGDTFTQAQLRGTVAQIRTGLTQLIRQMAGKIGDAAFEVGMASARQMLTDVAKLESKFTGAMVPLPLLETARLHGLVGDTTSSLLRFHETSMARYGTHLVGQMEMALAAGMASGDTHSEAIDRMMKVGDLEWYRGERIVRTELSYAASASSKAAAAAQAAELDGDLWTRWCEHVSDGGAPLDDRVGEDSEALHGQVAPPGGEFTQPAITPKGEEVQRTLVGRSWPHPPNRPNDRAVLTPWRAHWGVPGWIWRGRRVPVTQAIADEINGKYTPPPELARAEDRPGKAAAAELPSALPKTARERGAEEAAAANDEDTAAADQARTAAFVEAPIPVDDEPPRRARRQAAIPPKPPLPDWGEPWARRTQGHLDYVQAVEGVDHPMDRLAIAQRTPSPWAHIPVAELDEFHENHLRIADELRQRREWMEQHDPDTRRALRARQRAEREAATEARRVARIQRAADRDAVRAQRIADAAAKKAAGEAAELAAQEAKAAKEIEASAARAEEIRAADQAKSEPIAAPPPMTARAQYRAGVAARREAREEQRALREAMAPPKNPKRVAAAKIAAEASAERLREIYSAVKGNLSSDLHVVWDKEGHKFLQQEAGRIRGIKDRINAASKISEAFAEKYGSGELGGMIGNEGDMFYKRNEIEAEHFEAKADEQERKYYEEMRRAELEAGRIDEHGEPIKQHGHEVDDWGEPPAKSHDDDPPF